MKCHALARGYLHGLVRDTLKPYVPSDTTYQALFDIYEYLLALVYLDSCPRSSNFNGGPLGCFAWRYRNAPEDGLSTPIDEFFSKGIALGKGWGLLTAGFFGSSPERATEIRDKFGTFLKEWRYRNL